MDLLLGRGKLNLILPNSRESKGKSNQRNSSGALDEQHIFGNEFFTKIQNFKFLVKGLWKKINP